MVRGVHASKSSPLLLLRTAVIVCTPPSWKYLGVLVRRLSLHSDPNVHVAGIARIAATPAARSYLFHHLEYVCRIRENRPSNTEGDSTRPTTTTFVYENREVGEGGEEGGRIPSPRVVSVDFEQSLFRGMVR